MDTIGLDKLYYATFSADEQGNETYNTPKALAKANGTYRYFWLYRVKFAVPAAALTTKSDSIDFSIPEIEGTILHRTKPDAAGRLPWKA